MPALVLKLVRTNNYFGQHDFVLENVDNAEQVITELNSIKWHKKPVVNNVDGNINIHCFTNYDKVKLEGKFSNG